MKTQLGLEPSSFFVHFPKAGDWPNLNIEGSGFSVESGFLSLAVGLAMKSASVPPNGNVWSSAREATGGGFGSVGGLDVKIEYAISLNAKMFFVPQLQLTQAQEIANGRLKILEAEFTTDLRTSLGLILAHSRVPPPRNAPFEARYIHYKNLLDDNENVAKDYYRNSLITDIVRDCQKMVGKTQVSRMPKTLVCIASHNPEVISISVDVFEIDKCLILYTAGMENFASNAVSLIEKHDNCSVIEPCKFVVPDFSHGKEVFQTELRELNSLVTSWLKENDESTATFDVTSGTTFMKAMMIKIAEARDDWLIILKHEMEKTAKDRNTVKHGTEQYIAWQGQTPWL